MAGKASEAEVLSLIEDIRASGAVDEALAVAEDYAQQARNVLARVPADDETRQTLTDLTYFTVNRDH